MNHLFVWTNMESLKRYGTGKVIALAPSAEEARAFAIYLFEQEQQEMYGLPEFYEDRLAAFRAEMAKVPDCYSTLAALIEWGSE